MTPAPRPIRDTAEESDPAAIQAFFAAMQKSERARDAARERLAAAAPILIRAIRTGSGQGVKVCALVWSCWNGAHIVGLCDVLCGLDIDIADAVTSLIYARAHLGGDADDQIREILRASGEFAALEAAESATPAGEECIYPLPLHTPAALRRMAHAIEAFQTSGKRAA